MKKYISPSLTIETYDVATSILEGSYHAAQGIGGSGQDPVTDPTPGGEYFGGARYRGGCTSSRDDMVGSWRRGGLW